MWRWLPSGLYNRSTFYVSQRRLFFLQLCGFVFGVHLVVFGAYGFFGWLQSGKDRFDISLHQQGATYVLMPLQKKVEHQNKLQTIAQGDVRKKSNVIDHETYQKKKAARKKTGSTKKTVDAVQQKKEAASAAKKQLPAKVAQPIEVQQASVILKSSTTPSSAKTLKKIKAAKLSRKEKLAKSKRKKSVTKIQELPEQTRSEQATPEQVIVQKDVSEQLAEQQTLALEEKKAVEQSVQQEVKQEVAGQSEQETDEEFDENNVVFVGYEQLDQSLIGSKIQYTIQENWTPPVGMDKNVACDVRVKIGADGQAVDAKIVKGSGVFVYDASARKTLLSIEYPKEVWNKTITIALGS